MKVQIYRPEYQAQYQMDGRNKDWFVSIPIPQNKISNLDDVSKKLFSEAAIVNPSKSKLFDSYDNFRRVMLPVLQDAGAPVDFDPLRIKVYKHKSELISKEPSLLSDLLAAEKTPLPKKTKRRKLVSFTYEPLDGQTGPSYVSISVADALEEVLALAPNGARAYYSRNSHPSILVEQSQAQDLIGAINKNTNYRVAEMLLRNYDVNEGIGSLLPTLCPLDELLITPRDPDQSAVIVHRETGEPFRASTHYVAKPGSNRKQNVGGWTINIRMESGWRRMTHFLAARQYRSATAAEAANLMELYVANGRSMRPKSTSLIDMARNVSGSGELALRRYQFVTTAGGVTKTGFMAMPRDVFAKVVAAGKISYETGTEGTRVTPQTVYMRFEEFRNQMQPALEAQGIEYGVTSSHELPEDYYKRSVPFSAQLIMKDAFSPGAKFLFRGKPVTYMGKVPSNELVKLSSPFNGQVKCYIELEQLCEELGKEPDQGFPVSYRGGVFSWEPATVLDGGKYKLIHNNGDIVVDDDDKIFPFLESANDSDLLFCGVDECGEIADLRDVDNEIDACSVEHVSCIQYDLFANMLDVDDGQATIEQQNGNDKQTMTRGLHA